MGCLCPRGAPALCLGQCCGQPCIPQKSSWVLEPGQRAQVPTAAISPGSTGSERTWPEKSLLCFALFTVTATETTLGGWDLQLSSRCPWPCPAACLAGPGCELTIVSLCRREPRRYLKIPCHMGANSKGPPAAWIKFEMLIGGERPCEYSLLPPAGLLVYFFGGTFIPGSVFSQSFMSCEHTLIQRL